MGPGQTAGDAGLFVFWWLNLLAAFYLLWRALYPRQRTLAATIAIGAPILIVGAVILFDQQLTEVIEKAANPLPLAFNPLLFPFSRTTATIAYLALVCTVIAVERFYSQSSGHSSYGRATIWLQTIVAAVVLYALCALVLLGIEESVLQLLFGM